ncbi:S1 RNA-binding domain-containing protein [Bdellovibrio bacteriovorus]|uniref:CvfB family protein n=1 Tax=Bdellovibrio TaxID=958 RepID=UPI0035A92C11
MIEIGRLNKLKVLKHVDFGVFLDGEVDGEILLPLRYMPENCEVGDTVEVFVMFDSEDRLMATTETPKAMVGDFALLKVVAVESVGAFLDWGLAKDLFLPYAEQIHTPRVGQDIIVYIYTDKSDRISASMRLDRYVEKTATDYKEGQPVQLLIAGKTDLGYKALVDNKYWGVIYENEVFQPLKYGQRTQGFIKKLRPDGKIDLILQKTDKVGHEAAEDIAPLIMDMLQKKGGYLAINDKTPADTIYNLFGVSKKKYKIALGGLYKKRLITVDDDGIRLANKNS